jgi:hypothetical protein
MPASEALTQLTQTHGNSKAVKLWLADALRDGSLEAKAAATWVSESAKLNFRLPDKATSLEEDVIIPASRWQASKTWAADQEQWRWPYDHFFVTIRRKPRRRRIFKGVRFSNARIDQFSRLSTPNLSVGDTTTRKRGGGRPTAASKWGIVASTLVKMEMNGEIASDLDLTPHGLATKLMSRTDELLGQTAMDGFCKSFLEEYRKP